MSLLPGYFGLGKKEKALENMDSKLKKPHKISAGEGPVSYCSSICETKCSSLWTSKGKSKIFLTKDILGFRVFCLSFILRKMRIFQQDFLCLLRGMEPMGPDHSWLRAEPFLVGIRGIEMIFQVPSKPNYSIIPRTNFPLSHLKAAVCTLWFHPRIHVGFKDNDYF